MATTVTKLGSVAENLTIGITGASDWALLTRALTNDNLHATNNFNGGVGTSNYLYVSGFAMGLPSTAVIEGISALVDRHGTAGTEDYYVGLIYDDSGSLQITTPGKQLAPKWPASDASVTYGGAADLWGTPFAYTDINHADFGFAIAIEGNPSNLDSGSVDYVELTVYYHQVINHTPTGGVGASGSATVTLNDIVDLTSAGSKGGGVALLPFVIGVDSAGSVASGSAPSEHGIPGRGGATLASTALVTVVYNTALVANEYDTLATSEKAVPTEVHSLTAVGDFWLDTAGQRIYWTIRHTVGGLNAIRLRGPATKTGTAATIVNISSLQGVVSPIIGSAAVTPQEVTDIQNGLWYVFFRDSINQSFRAQLVTDISNVGGTSLVSLIVGVSGGAVSSGTSLPSVRFTQVGSGGATGGGNALSYVVVGVSGGAAMAGSASLLLIRQPQISGGAALAGTVPVSNQFSPVVSGGAVAGGQGVPGIQPAIGGGAVLNGLHIEQHLVIPPISGGVTAAPSHVKQQTYAAQRQEGGVIGGARSLAEKLKFFSGVKRGYGAAMGSSNILTVLPDTTVKLIEPHGSQNPTLDENRFRIEHEPGWCDPEEACVDGLLPKVIQRRQKGILPPRGGRTTVRDRSIATSNAST